MKRWLPQSVRARTTLAAVVVTALVLAIASVIIVQLVERDLEDNARAALSDALDRHELLDLGDVDPDGSSCVVAEVPDLQLPMLDPVAQPGIDRCRL